MTSTRQIAKDWWNSLSYSDAWEVSMRNLDILPGWPARGGFETFKSREIRALWFREVKNKGNQGVLKTSLNQVVETISREIYNKELKPGMIVLYSKNNGYYRVSKVTTNTVNLKTIFGKTVMYKGIPISDVKEDEETWYEKWKESETYKSM